MPMILGGSGTINTSSSLAVAVGGVEDLRVDANGNVGIGTTSPTFKIDVSAGSQGTAANNQVLLQRFYTSSAISGGNSNFLELTDTRTVAGSSWNGCGARIQHKVDADYQAYIQFNGGNDYGISFGTGASSVSSTGVTESMRIDSNGRVTTPKQPSFHVYNNTNNGNHMNDVNGVILWNQVVFNVGGHYSTSTGRFTAPVSGKYMFNIRHLHNGANGYGPVSMYIRKNGSNYPAGQLLFHNYPSWTMASNVVLVELNASDYVDINVTDGTWHDFHNEFSGFLIG